MPEKIQHPYECLAKGHEGGSRTFFAAPPEWFAQKGMQGTPKNCPNCRAWINAQTDEKRKCDCGAEFRIPQRYKISHFKKIGPYVPETECRSCRDGERPPKGMDERPSREKREQDKKKKRAGEFNDLVRGIQPEARVIITEGPFYTETPQYGRESRIAHLGHHVPGSPYDQTTQSAAASIGASATKSPSSFASGSTVEGLLANAHQLLLMSDDAHVREYRDQFGRIVRVTFTGDHDRLEISILASLPGETYGLVTTYDNVTVQDIYGQSWYNG